MSRVAIIQARMGSSRLPGKVLQDIQGKAMLERVIERVLMATTIDHLIVATTTETGDDVIQKVTEGRNPRVTVFRGSEQDVLDRYYQAAKAAGATVIVRITSDCPLVDPDVIDRIVSRLIGSPHLDYVANVLGKRTYPRGLDVEAFRFSLLEAMHALAHEAEDREHVTLYLRKHPERYETANIEGEKDYSDLRWTVDEQVDLDVVREIYHALHPATGFRMRDILALLETRPELKTRNQTVIQKLAHAGF